MKGFDYLILTLVLFSIFMSGCILNIKPSSGSVHACFCKNCMVKAFNGWQPIIDSADNSFVDFKSEEDCRKACNDRLGVRDDFYASLTPRVYGVDYNYVLLTKDEQEKISDLINAFKHNPYSEVQNPRVDDFLKINPKLAFYKQPCVCPAICVSPSSIQINVKANAYQLSSFSCGSTDDLELGYLPVHNSCCWWNFCKNNPNTDFCSNFKCGELTSASKIPACGCLCGGKLLTYEDHKCCKHDTIVSC